MRGVAAARTTRAATAITTTTEGLWLGNDGSLAKENSIVRSFG